MVHCNCETAGRFLATAREVDLALRAVGSVWSAFGSCGRVMKVEWWYCQTDFFVYLLCRRMNSADRNDLMPAPAQEKLEWVTPKISLMGAGTTDGKGPPGLKEATTLLIYKKGPS